MVATKENIASTSQNNAHTAPAEIRISDLQADVKLIIHNPATGERLAYGPGVAKLCSGVKEHGSLKAAAEDMGMAYSKAWKIIGEAEDALQLQLVLRQAPKGCLLTKAGEDLLAGYLEINEDISKYAEYRFDRIFDQEQGA